MALDTPNFGDGAMTEMAGASISLSQCHAPGSNPSYSPGCLRLFEGVSTMGPFETRVLRQKKISDMLKQSCEQFDSDALDFSIPDKLSQYSLLYCSFSGLSGIIMKSFLIHKKGSRRYGQNFKSKKV